MDRSTDKTYLFEQMPASQAVRRQILPAIASQMVLLAYNLADTYFVGLLNDPLQTAAVSVAYTITVLMTAIANLFAVGGASCMARALGRHEDTDARCIAAISFLVVSACGGAVFRCVRLACITIAASVRSYVGDVCVGVPLCQMGSYLGRSLRHHQHFTCKPLARRGQCGDSVGRRISGRPYQHCPGSAIRTTAVFGIGVQGRDWLQPSPMALVRCFCSSAFLTGAAALWYRCGPAACGIP